MKPPPLGGGRSYTLYKNELSVDDIVSTILNSLQENSNEIIRKSLSMIAEISVVNDNPEELKKALFNMLDTMRDILPAQGEYVGHPRVFIGYSQRRYNDNGGFKADWDLFHPEFIDLLLNPNKDTPLPSDNRLTFGAGSETFKTVRREAARSKPGRLFFPILKAATPKLERMINKMCEERLGLPRKERPSSIRASIIFQ